MHLLFAVIYLALIKGNRKRLEGRNRRHDIALDPDKLMVNADVDGRMQWVCFRRDTQ
jgi:hypothetical protein